MKHTVRRPFAVAVVAGLAVLVIGTSVAVGAIVATNGGPVTAVRTKTANNEVRTINSTWVDMPGMSLSATVPKDEMAIFVITFSANSYCFGDSACIVQVMYNKRPLRPGAVIWASADDTGVKTTSMQWVTDPLGPGVHDFKVQYGGTAAVFTVLARTLTVLRAQVP